jgi:hypothetical protein
MSYPYPPMEPGRQPPGGQPGGWGGMPPAPGGYGPPPVPGGYGPPPVPGGYGPPPVPGWQGPEALPGGAPMGPPPMGGPPMGSPPGKGNGGLVLVLILAGLVLVGGVLGGAYYVAASGDDSGSTSARSTPSAAASTSAGRAPVSSSGQNKPGYYNTMKSWSLWNTLNTAAQDSKPMTLGEVFNDPQSKAEKDTSDGTVFNLQGTGRLDTDCGGTVWGPALKTALQSYGCTQVVRAAYVSADQRWTGQLAIFNLKDVNSANALLQDLDPKSGRGFFLPVAGPPPVDQFGKGSTGAESGAYGHFVVVGWAGHADGRQGSDYGTDTISPSSTVQEAGKEFLFHRN